MISKSTIKYIQSLQHKKFRDEYNVFVAEGPKVVEGILESAIFPVKAIYALQDWVDRLGKESYSMYNAHIEIVKDFELEKLASYATANKVVAVFEKKTDRTDVDIKGRWTLMLDDLQDPGNFGTIIRTADWFAVENIICSDHTVDMYNSKVVQSTMASLGRVNIVYTDLLSWIKAHKGVRFYASALNGRNINDMKDVPQGVIIIGNESKGVSEAVMALADQKITIPGRGNAESLNAAVAAGIILSKFII